MYILYGVFCFARKLLIPNSTREKGSFQAWNMSWISSTETFWYCLLLHLISSFRRV